MLICQSATMELHRVHPGCYTFGVLPAAAAAAVVVQTGRCFVAFEPFETSAAESVTSGLLAVVGQLGRVPVVPLLPVGFEPVAKFVAFGASQGYQGLKEQIQ